MKISKVSGPSGDYFQDESRKAFRRIVGGMSFPGSGKNGFVVVLGEDMEGDFEHRERHLRVIYESRDYLGQGFMEPVPVLKECSRLTRMMKVSRWMCLIGPYVYAVADHNREMFKTRQAPVNLVPPPGEHDFEYYAGLVKARMLHKKTLHLGEGTLPGKLASLPLDLSGEKFPDHPEVSALFFAVAGAELIGKDDTRSRAKRIRTSDAGY